MRRSCDGNLRSTIRVLIMANEYLENELQELQAAGSSDRAPARSLHAKGDAA
jgi:predicted DNA-binding ribbon-helix-helix protein